MRKCHCAAGNRGARGGCCEPEAARATELGTDFIEAATPDT